MGFFLDGLVSWTVSWMGFLDGFSWMGFLDGFFGRFLGWMDCEMCVKKDLEECAVILQ